MNSASSKLPGRAFYLPIERFLNQVTFNFYRVSRNDNLFLSVRPNSDRQTQSNKQHTAAENEL